MNLSTIISRIRAHNGTYLRQNVGGAADQAAALDECFIDGTYTGPLPMAFVVGGPDVPFDDQNDAGYLQGVVETFGVLVCIDARSDKEGLTAFEQVDPIRNELWRAILGWQPTGYQYPIAYAGSDIVDLNRSFLFVLYQFTVRKDIDDTDAADMEEIYGPFVDFTRFWGYVSATFHALGALDFTTAEPASPSNGDIYFSTTAGVSSVTSQTVEAWKMYEWLDSQGAWVDRGWDIRVQNGDTTAYCAMAVAITSPTSDPTYNTTEATISLAGTAAGADLASVDWTNVAACAAGTATLCAGVWCAASVALCAGSNVIEVVAHAPEGRTARDTLTVTRSAASWSLVAQFTGTTAEFDTVICAVESSVKDLSDVSGKTIKYSDGTTYGDVSGGVQTQLVIASTADAITAIPAVPSSPTALKVEFTGRITTVENGVSLFSVGVACGNTVHDLDVKFFEMRFTSSTIGCMIGYQTGATLNGLGDADSWWAVDPTIDHDYVLTLTTTELTLTVDGGATLFTIDNATFYSLYGVSFASIIASATNIYAYMDKSAPSFTFQRTTIGNLALYKQ